MHACKPTLCTYVSFGYLDNQRRSLNMTGAVEDTSLGRLIQGVEMLRRWRWKKKDLEDTAGGSISTGHGAGTRVADVLVVMVVARLKSVKTSDHRLADREGGGGEKTVANSWYVASGKARAGRWEK